MTAARCGVEINSAQCRLPADHDGKHLMTSPHAGRHSITLLGPNLCTCGQPIVLVETEPGSRNRPHWRHKPQGYQWGARAHRLRKAAQKVIDAALIEDRLPSSIEQAIMELQYAVRETR